MTRYAYRYPDGAVGLALLFLRMCYAFVAFGVAVELSATPVNANVLHLVAGLTALLLVIGFATRWVALLLGIEVVVAMVMSSPVQQLLLAGHLGGCVAMVLIGAGAYSTDARRHGRRVIQLQANTPDRGADD
jgi:putative oxidoreductase